MSVRELEKDKDKRYAFLKAFHKMKNLPPEHKDSFWSIASLNGQPFNVLRTALPESDKVWGGYSQHLNVLFLPWYRAYLLCFELALIRQADPGESSLVALPYLDTTVDLTLATGFPDLLMDEYVTIDDLGNTIPNPLLNFTLPVGIPASESSPGFSKPKGYTTCRYPFSGLNGPTGPIPASKVQNDYVLQNFRDPRTYLQENILYCLNKATPSIVQLFKDSLNSKTYNAFSNELSARKRGGVSVETACINMFSAIGGGSQTSNLMAGANGDVSCNEMSAFDPIFFLNMANIDRVFWIWQLKNNPNDPASTVVIDTMDKEDEGIKPKYGQGPAPNQSGDTVLDNSSKLFPFKIPVDQSEIANVNNVRDIEKQLKYTYSFGSLEQCKPVWDGTVHDGVDDKDDNGSGDFD